MRSRTLDALTFFVALAVGAGCPAGDGTDAKDSKKDGKTKTAAKDGKDAKDAKKADAKRDAKKADAKKADAKGDAKADDGGTDEPPAAPATGEEIAKWYQACWAAFGKDWDAFGKCYAADAVSIDPMGTHNGREEIVSMGKQMTSAFSDNVGALQLTLVNGNNAIGVARVGGTHTATMKMPGMPEIPATNKTYGVLAGHVVQLDDTGHEVTKEWFFMDSGSMMGQLGLSKDPHRKLLDKDWEGAPITVVAKNDDAEKANVEAHKAFTNSVNAKDVKGVGEALADDMVWSEGASPKDMNKKEFLKDLPGMYKAFSDLTITHDSVWGAGDYVVGTGTWAGTNDGDMKAMKLKKTGKKVSVPFLQVTQYKAGKIAKNWIFYDGMQFAIQLGLVPDPAAAPADGGAKPDAKGDAKADEKKADEKKADEKGG